MYGLECRFIEEKEY